MPRAKKKTLPDFPRRFVFESREELDAYFTGDRITCLLCGHRYRSLGPHLSSAHGTSVDEYREAYGIPYLKGLTSSEFTERQSAYGKAMFSENKDRQMSALRKAGAVQIQRGHPMRGKPHFWKKERTKYERKEFYEFARRVMAGRSGGSVEMDPDMPTKAHIFWYMKKDAEFRAYWKNVVSPLASSGLSQAKRSDLNKVA